MAMIGNQVNPGVQFKVSNDSYNGDGSTTTFTLSQSVSATTDIEVMVDNVQQSPYDSSYSVSGTTLTFSEAPATGTNNIYVFYRGSKHHSTAQMIPDDGSVHSSKIASNAVTPAKLHDDVLGPITVDATNNRIGINTTSPSVSLEIGATQQREEIKLQSTGGGSQAVLGTFGGTESYVGSTNNVPIYFRTNGINRAQIDTSGRYRNPNQPCFDVASTAGVSANNYQTYDTQYLNVGNHFDMSTNRFNVPVDGVYQFFATTIKGSGSSGGVSRLYIYVNGVVTRHSRHLRLSEGSTYGTNGVGSWLLSLSAGDYVQTYMVSGGSHGSREYTYFNGFLLG